MKRRSPQEQYAHLRMLNARGQLVLFVGAGVSQDCGLPSWSRLIERLTLKAFPNDKENIESVLGEYGNVTKTRILRNVLKQKFNGAVADCLYENSYKVSDNLDQIARCGVKRILTYNFDELIEEALATNDIEFDSFEPGDHFNSNYRGAVVFHPHGLIRSDMNDVELRQKSIVLSEEDYNQLNFQPYSWGNVVQLGLLTQFTCLFVGVSLSDPNTRKLLDVCRNLKIRHTHYALAKSPLYASANWDKPMAKLVKRSIETDFRSLGLEPVWINQWRDIADLFKSIRSTNNLKWKPTRTGR